MPLGSEPPGEERRGRGAAATLGERPAAAGTSEAIATRTGELAAAALMLLPGALVVFTGFNAGGYFPATPAIVAIVLTQILLVRILQSSRPFAGFAPATLVAIAALGLYTLLTLASALWSHALGRALIEFDRAWMYLLILILFGSVRARSEDLRRLIWGLLAGASIVCLAGLTSRVLPNVWHTAPAVSNERLSYPVTYWNTLGLLAALGIVLAFHITCSLRERRPARIAAAALIAAARGDAVLHVLARRDRRRRGRPARVRARGQAERAAQRRARDAARDGGAGARRLPREPARHDRPDHPRGGVSGPPRRARGGHLRGRGRGAAAAAGAHARPARCAAARAEPGSAAARARPRSARLPSWRSRRSSRSASLTASRTTGAGS